MVRPASRQISTKCVASLTSVEPQALKNSFFPPNVPVPNVRTGTLKPDPPSNRYSIVVRCCSIDQNRSSGKCSFLNWFLKSRFSADGVPESHLLPSPVFAMTVRGIQSFNQPCPRLLHHPPWLSSKLPRQIRRTTFLV